MTAESEPTVAHSRRSEVEERADRATVERLIAEERLRGDIRASLDKPAPRGLRALIGDRDLLRLLISALVIPAVVWIAGTAWQGIEDARNEPALAKARIEARQRADIGQMAVLLPWIGKPSAEGQIAREVLRSMAEAANGDPFVLRVYQTAVRTAAAQQSSADPSIRAQGAIAAESLSTVPAPPASAKVPPPAGVPLAPAAATLAAAVAVKPRSAYIQIYGEDQRAAASRLQTALREAGVPVPGIENVFQTQGTTPGAALLVRRSAQRGAIGVRYYAATDRSAAAFVASVAERVLPEGGSPRLQDLSSRASRAAPGIVEVWLPCTALQGC